MRQIAPFAHDLPAGASLGIDMVAGSLSIRAGRQPDWGALASEIASLELATLVDRRDEFFPIDNWRYDTGLSDPDAWVDTDAAASFELLHGGRALLREAAEVVRGAVEGQNDGVLRVESEAGTSWICVSTDAFTPHDDLVWEFQAFAESGLAEAAGFEGFETSRPRVQNLAGYEPEERRLIRAAEIYSYADHLVALRDPVFTGDDPTEWAERWTGTLLDLRADAASTPERGLRLFDLLLDAIELSFALNRVGRDRLDAERDDVVRRLQLELVSDGLGRIPVTATRPQLDGATASFGPWPSIVAHTLAEMTDTASTASPDVSVARRCWDEFIGNFLGELVFALGDLFGVQSLRAYAAEAAPVEAHPRSAEYEVGEVPGHFSFIRYREIDWDAGREEVTRRNAPTLADDLNLLEAIVSDQQFSRLANPFELLDSTLWVVLSGEFHGLDSALGRLGRAGVLEALELIDWHAPRREET